MDSVSWLLLREKMLARRTFYYILQLGPPQIITLLTPIHLLVEERNCYCSIEALHISCSVSVQKKSANDPPLRSVYHSVLMEFERHFAIIL